MTEGTVFTHDDDGFHVQADSRGTAVSVLPLRCRRGRDESCECDHVLDEHDRQLACTAVVR
jgi:hypothetical protein